MTEREELEQLRKMKRLRELESKEAESTGMANTLGGNLAAGVQGFSRGLSLGTSDDRMARAEAASRTGSDEALLASFNPMVANPALVEFEEAQDPFQKAYEESRGQQEALKEAHPKSALTGEILGGVAPNSPSALALGAGEKILGAGGKALLETGAGKAVTSGAKKVTGKIANRLAALGEDMGTLAEKNALRSAGAQKSQMKALVNKGRVKDTGRFIIDENIVPPGASADEIFETASKLKKEAGEQISSVFDDIEKAGSGGTFDRREMAEGLRNSIYGDDAVAGSLDADKIVPQLEKYIADFEAKKGAASARELLELKGKFDARINYSKKAMDLPELQQGYRNLRGAINDAINTRAENLSNKVRGNLAERLKNANRRYGLASEVETIAENRLAQEGNRFFSLTDSIAGAAGGAAGLATGGLSAIPLAIGAAGANKALRTYGPSVGTKSLDAISKALKAAGGVGTEAAVERATPLATRLAALEGNPGIGERPSFVRTNRRQKLRMKAMGE